SEIEACHSVAGDENYILKVRVATPLELEHLLPHHPVRALPRVLWADGGVSACAGRPRP
ncbi:Lrp/AsnC ligand binding domain-containing protein, partial [Streptomyces lavendulocolor]